MTFGADHYVPVLKVKRGEKRALGALPHRVRSRVTPLLEVVERTTKPIDAHLTTTFRDLAKAVHGFGRCFLDARELAPDGHEAAAEVFRRAAAAGISFTPVTGVSRAADVGAALSHRARGVAIRLTRDELESGHTAHELAGFLTRHGLTPEDADLIVDLGAVDDLVSAGVEAMTSALLEEVPHTLRWRTFTVSACAFPYAMGGLQRNTHDQAERMDWVAWRDALFQRRDTEDRLPTYSDAAIQHPSGVEGFDPRTMQVSAAVRYTSGDDWLLVKGESTRRTPASEQFPQLATRLVYGHLRDHFKGADHCAGCRGMKAAADGAAGFGAPEVWRTLGTIHHITTVAEDLQALPWP